jgi:CheY-like chemotaxis protein
MTTVLVVDDAAADRQLAGGLLKANTGWTVLYATDGTDAMRQIELHVPDIVLTDLQMPHMNGLELVAAMKSAYPLLPVVLMTAKGSEEIAVKALEAGAASYVPKRRLALEMEEILGRVLAASREERNYFRLMHRLQRHESSFELENDLSLITSVVSFLKQVIAQMRFCDEPDRLRIGVALEEALLNSYYHGNLEVSSELRETDHAAYYDLARQRQQEEPYRDRRIHMEARLTQREAVYVVRDEGPGFDPSQIPDATAPANLERPCGRGLLLMRTFMDHVIFNDSGNEVTLIKNRAPRTAGA